MGREHLYKYLPATQAELPVRKMSVSQPLTMFFFKYVFNKLFLVLLI